MNTDESLHLHALVTDQYGLVAAYRRQIGNGTWIVVLCRTDDEFWILWDFSAWHAHRRAEKVAARIEKARAKAQRKQLLEVAV
jgi:hypothetical protein